MRVRSRRRLRHVRNAAIALFGVLAAATSAAAPPHASAEAVHVGSSRAIDRAPRRTTGRAAPTARTSARTLAPRKASTHADARRMTLDSAARTWAEALPALEVRNPKTNARATLRLYAGDGGVDRPALREFMRVAGSAADLPDDADGEVAEPLDPRLVQLAVRAAYHFDGAPIVVVSATRKGANGKHGSGDALDFRLEGVRASKLAAYVRSFPRVGVGIYTHPKTQFVHLDVRDRSYHWIDASPPGVTWREKRLRDPAQERRDASYAPALDLPELALRFL